MFNRRIKTELQSSQLELNAYKAMLDAVRRHVAVIEFTPDGVILDANELFLQLTGYSFSQLEGQSPPPALLGGGGYLAGVSAVLE